MKLVVALVFVHTSVYTYSIYIFLRSMELEIFIGLIIYMLAYLIFQLNVVTFCIGSLIFSALGYFPTLIACALVLSHKSDAFIRVKWMFANKQKKTREKKCAHTNTNTKPRKRRERKKNLTATQLEATAMHFSSPTQSLFLN